MPFTGGGGRSRVEVPVGSFQERVLPNVRQVLEMSRYQAKFLAELSRKDTMHTYIHTHLKILICPIRQGNFEAKIYSTSGEYIATSSPK